MKKLSLLLMPLLIIPFLVNCKGGDKYDDNCPYLTFNAEEDSSVKYVITGSLPDIKMEYSVDMNSWKTWNHDQLVTIEKEKKIYVRNNSECLSVNNYNYVNFVMSGQIAASGKISSLNNSNVLHKNEYYNLFSNCKSLVRAPALPMTTLAESCYHDMFINCSNLKKAPKLPATTLASYCYHDMFSDCTSLIEAPELPATTLAYACYYLMFYGCTSLTKAPRLPATTLATFCYEYMFRECDALTEAPALPATTLVEGCYDSMFLDCDSLTKAPELPATTLVDSCYESMFCDCVNLKEAPKLPATTLTKSCYWHMFYNCYSLETLKVDFGTSESCDWPSANECTKDWLYNAGKNAVTPIFIWNGKTSGFPEGWRTDSTIPEKWNVQNYA